MPESRQPNMPLADVIVFGASGFTGRLVAEYLAKACADNDRIRWAIAGRNRDKLEKVSNSLRPRANPAIIVADTSDPESMRRLAQAGRVLISTVGPYAKFGEPLVSACVDAGTVYCDLCGEVQWMREMIDRYQAAAAESGAVLVMSCGFDSIPSDIGVRLLQAESMQRYGAPLCSVELLVRALRGGASGGTYASMLNAVRQARADSTTARILADPYALCPAGERSGPGPRDQRRWRFAADAGVWTAPFVMASVNTRVVRRTNALLGYPYGREFRYREATATGAGVRGCLRASFMTLVLGAFVLASSYQWSRRVILRPLLPAPGRGPSRVERESGFFKLQLSGKTASGDTLTLVVRGDRDPGYGSTARMLGEAALALAAGEPGVGGGFWTPAAALGADFHLRLASKAGVTFELEA